MTAGITIDEQAIRARAREMRRKESPSVDLQVFLAGLDRHRAAEMVRTLLADSPAAELVYPTSAGVYVFVTEAKDGLAVAEKIATGIGNEAAGTVTAPVTFDLDPILRTDVGSLTAVLAFTMDPPIEAGPFNDYGIPAYRWGVSADLTNSVLTAAVTWATDGRLSGETAGAGPIIPVGPEDASEIIGLRLQAMQQHVSLVVPNAGLGARIADIHVFGQVSLTELPREGATVNLAQQLADILRAHAADLDVATVQPLEPGLTSAIGHPEGARWIWNRHQWSSHVIDAAGIQLLTGAHLERATDLSAWQVEKVTTDRWLVTARDLTPWYDIPNYTSWRRSHIEPPDYLVAARRDFGAMILSDESAWKPGTPYPSRFS